MEELFKEGIRRGLTAGPGEFERVGFEQPSVMVGLGKHITKYTPRERALQRLEDALQKYPEFTKEARRTIQNEFTDLPDLEILNMGTLAGVLSFLNSYPSPTPANFKDNVIVPFFQQIYPDNYFKLSPEEQEIMKTRFKAQFLKYIRVVSLYR